MPVRHPWENSSLFASFPCFHQFSLCQRQTDIFKYSLGYVVNLEDTPLPPKKTSALLCIAVVISAWRSSGCFSAFLSQFLLCSGPFKLICLTHWFQLDKAVIDQYLHQFPLLIHLFDAIMGLNEESARSIVSAPGGKNTEEPTHQPAEQTQPWWFMMLCFFFQSSCLSSVWVSFLPWFFNRETWPYSPPACATYIFLLTHSTGVVAFNSVIH